MFTTSLSCSQLNVEASDFLKELQNKLNSVMDDLSRIFAVRYVPGAFSPWGPFENLCSSGFVPTLQLPAPDRGQRASDGRHPGPGQRSDGAGQRQRGAGGRQRPAAHHGLPGQQVRGGLAGFLSTKVWFLVPGAASERPPPPHVYV